MKIKNIKQLEKDKVYFVLETLCKDGIETGIPKSAYIIRFASLNDNRPGGKLITAHIKIKETAGAKEYGGILIGDANGKLIRASGDAPFRHIYATRKEAGEFLHNLIVSKINGWDCHEAIKEKKQTELTCPCCGKQINRDSAIWSDGEQFCAHTCVLLVSLISAYRDSPRFSADLKELRDYMYHEVTGAWRGQ